jgi:outer membrane protein, heavy metal efflux system
MDHGPGAAMIAMRRTPSLIALSCMLAACYSPPPLDASAMLREQRRSRSVEGSVAGRLAEDEAVRLAVTSSAQVKVARATVNEAKGGASRARAFDNPELRVDNAWLRRGTATLDRDVYRLGLDMRVFLPSLAERPARVDAADAAVTVAEASASLQEAVVRHDVRMAYSRVATARERQTLLTRLVAVRHERQEKLKVSVQGGLTVAGDLALARVGEEEARDRLGRAEEELSDSLASLSRILGTELGNPDSLALPAAPPCRPPPADTSAIEDRILVTSPALEQRRASHQRAQEEARAEHLARWPRLKYVEVGYNRNFLVGSETVLPGYEIEPRYYAWSAHVGLALELPIWNWNGGKVQAAEARADGETARFRETLATTVSGLHKSLIRWRNGHDRAERARSSGVPAAEEALRVTRQAVDAGRLPTNAALDAEEKVLLARIALLDDLLACRTAQLEIEAALGKEL